MEIAILSCTSNRSFKIKKSTTDSKEKWAKIKIIIQTVSRTDLIIKTRIVHYRRINSNVTTKQYVNTCRRLNIHTNTSYANFFLVILPTLQQRAAVYCSKIHCN